MIMGTFVCNLGVFVDYNDAMLVWFVGLFFPFDLPFYAILYFHLEKETHSTSQNLMAIILFWPRNLSLKLS